MQTRVLVVVVAVLLVAMLRGARATATERFIDQHVDHFSGSNKDMFKQRYFVNSTFWKPSGPVFLIIGGDQPLTPRMVTVGNALELASKMNALVFALEHRFFGKSFPAADMSVESLALLDVQQALMDVTLFREAMHREHSTGDSPWIAMGCSYGGALAAWMRIKFPHVVRGAVASSAPLNLIVEDPSYDTAVAGGLWSDCLAGFRHALREVDYLLDTGGPGVVSDLKTLFGCAAETTKTELQYVLADVVGYVVQYHKQQDLCPLVSHADDTEGHRYNRVQQLKVVAQRAWEGMGLTCDKVNPGAQTAVAKDESAYMRQWWYLSCSQLGFFQVAPANNSLRADVIDLQWHLDTCSKLFGEVMSAPPDVSAMLSYYGGTNFHGTNVVFVNGETDPWRGLFMEKIMVEDKPSVDVVTIQNGGHCADMGAPVASDTMTVISARDTVRGFISEWVDEAPNDDVVVEKAWMSRKAFGIIAFSIAMGGLLVGTLLGWYAQKRHSHASYI